MCLAGTVKGQQLPYGSDSTLLRSYTVLGIYVCFQSNDFVTYRLVRILIIYVWTVLAALNKDGVRGIAAGICFVSDGV